MLFRNMLFLIFRVARDLDQLHTIQKRSRNALHRIRRRDKQHLGEVDRDFHIVIAEFLILLRI